MQISAGIWSHLPLYSAQPVTTRRSMPRARTEFQEISHSFCFGRQIPSAFFTAMRRSVSADTGQHVSLIDFGDEEGKLNCSGIV